MIYAGKILFHQSRISPKGWRIVMDGARPLVIWPDDICELVRKYRTTFPAARIVVRASARGEPR